MLTQIFAYKHIMTQAWTAEGKRVPVTRLQLPKTSLVRAMLETATPKILVGIGDRQFDNLAKPQRGILEKASLTRGVAHFREVEIAAEDKEAVAAVTLGAELPLSAEFAVGDVIEIQGTTKGKGFAGVMKRHNFHGGPRTHGQSDRARAPGSIGQRTTPGRVHKGKRMAGHMGVDTVTVKGLVVLYVDDVNQELWVSGPVPGHNQTLLCVSKSGRKQTIELDRKASNLPEVVAPEAAPVAEVEVQAEAPVVEVETEVTPEVEEVKSETPAV